MDFLDFKSALQKLPPDQREALILVGASGLSYEAAADICKCAVGTMKSRVNRGRARLIELLALKTNADFDGDGRFVAATQSGIAFSSNSVRLD
jgi:RNA polymerase sigma-70 factor (ECF subfamily)